MYISLHTAPSNEDEPLIKCGSAQVQPRVGLAIEYICTLHLAYQVYLKHKSFSKNCSIITGR